MKSTRFLTQAAVIGALYVVLTIVFAPISYGPVQFRISEVMTVLPFLTPAAIPGLFVGCIVANIYGVAVAGSSMLADIFFGSIATLIAAYLSRKMSKRFLVPLPPVIVNGIIVGYELSIFFKLPVLSTMGWVAFGELVVCYALGYPLLVFMDKYKKVLFKNLI